jgi:hypothetical protein
MKNQIMNQIILKLYQNKEESEQHDEDSEVFLSFSKIDSQTADKILEEVDRQVERHFVRAGYNSHTQTLSFLLMPTFVHNSHQSWLFYSIQKASIQQVFTIQEAANMRISTGSRELYYKIISCYDNYLTTLFRSSWFLGSVFRVA